KTKLQDVISISIHYCWQHLSSQHSAATIQHQSAKLITSSPFCDSNMHNQIDINSLSDISKPKHMTTGKALAVIKPGVSLSQIYIVVTSKVVKDQPRVKSPTEVTVISKKATGGFSVYKS
uniref:Uncharacterized protein n=1 Tax=Triticum urartu TaxID=4572 RepID=A0A8R7TYH0_TRIUA